MYCWNYKVASSFLMALMFKSVTNGSELELGILPWTLQNSMSPRTMAEWRLGAGAGANILVVRHPMVRLVSAYRDRIEGLKASLRIYQHIDRGESIIFTLKINGLIHICSAWSGQDGRPVAASSDKKCAGPGAASEVHQQARGGAQLAGVCQVPPGHGQAELCKCPPHDASQSDVTIMSGSSLGPGH